MRRHRLRLRNKFSRAGMTLIELVAAVAVFAIITTELLVLRSQAMEMAAKARNIRIAKELARQKMEEYLIYMNNLPEEGTGQSINIDPPDPSGQFDSHPGFYWEFEEDTQDMDILLPEEEEDPEEEQEEDEPHYMVEVKLKIFRQESQNKDPDVLIVLNTLREETPDEKAMNTQ